MIKFLVIAYSRHSERCDDEANWSAIQQHLNLSGDNGWALVFNSKALKVFSNKPTGDVLGQAPLCTSGGIILGRAFGQSGSRVGSLIDAQQARLLFERRGKPLGERYWGQYVAFISVENDFAVVRDPSGAFPCFYTQYEGFELFFSDINSVLSSAQIETKIEINCLVNSLYVPRIAKTELPLQPFGEVLPGECRISREPRHKFFIWDPRDHIPRESRSDIQGLASGIETAVRNTVFALAGEFSSVALSLGGLDSSVVLSILSECAPNARVFNNRTSSMAGDESEYATHVAAHFGFPIRIIDLDSRRVTLDAITGFRNLASPPSYVDIVGLSSSEDRALALSGTQAMFTGVGGDNVFYQEADVEPAVDCIRSDAGWREKAQAVLDAARYSHKTVWQIGNALVQDRVGMRSNNLQFAINRSFKKFPGTRDWTWNDVNHSATLHPLLRDMDQVPPGKALHVFTSCFAPVEHQDIFNTLYGSERLDIFFMQPVVEACLAVPTWQLILRGIDRGMERRAFASRLPPRILRRRTKSSTQELYNRFLNVHRASIRDYLLGGYLSDHEILDLQEIEAMLHGRGDPAEPPAIPLLNLVQFEAWARQWS